VGAISFDVTKLDAARRAAFEIVEELRTSVRARWAAAFFFDLGDTPRLRSGQAPARRRHCRECLKAWSAIGALGRQIYGSRRVCLGRALRQRAAPNNGLRFPITHQKHLKNSHEHMAQSGDGPVVLRARSSGAACGKKFVMDASFEVRKGETLAIAGPSGSGKSSLLRLLNRLDEPTSGTVYLDGVDYRKIAPRELRRRVAWSRSGLTCFREPWRRTCDSGRGSGGKSSTKAALKSCSRALGWRLRFERRCESVRGEAQRVSFARTLANSPEGLCLMSRLRSG